MEDFTLLAENVKNGRNISASRASGNWVQIAPKIAMIEPD